MSLINDALKRTAGAQKQDNQAKQPLPTMQPVERLRRKNPMAIYIVASLVLFSLSIVLLAIWVVSSSSNKGKNAQIGKNSQMVVKSGLADSETKSPSKFEDNAASPIKIPMPNSNIIHSDKQFTQEIGRTVTVKIAQFPSQNSQKTEINVGIEPSPVSKSNEVVLANPNTNEILQEIVQDTINSTNNPKAADAVISDNEKTAIQTNVSVVQETIKPVFPQLKLTGIFYRQSNPSAIINGKLVYKDGIINGAKVISIDKNSVTIEFSNHTQVIKM
ncbi:MAG TPA: hypothetical protein PLW02_06840 [Verrucomicrobiota bacterium]|nr:hypothetical protein [Verrucomicrobiota bacterium]